MSDDLIQLYSTLEAYEAEQKKHTYEKLMRSFSKSPKHIEAFELYPPILFIKGGWRSAKTSIAIISAIAQMAGKHKGQLEGKLRMPGLKIRIFSSDFTEGHLGVIQPRLEQYLPDDWTIDYSQLKHLATITPPGVPFSTIQFCTYNQKLTKLGGTDLDLIICDEVPPEDIFFQSLGRLMDRDGRIIVAATPDYGFDWTYYSLYIPWEAGERPDVAYVTFTTDDNVDENGNPRIDAAAKARTARGMTTEQRNAKIGGQYVALSGLVWPEIDDPAIRDQQIIDFKVPSGWCHFWVMDYHTRTPAHCIWGGFSPEKELWIYAAASYQTTLAKMAEAIRAREGNKKILQRLIDVTAAQPERGGDTLESALDKLDRAGLRPLDSVREKDTSMSIQLVRDMITEGKLFINRTECRELVTQMRHYQWQEDFGKRKLENKKDRVRHYESHYVDCLRYMVMYGPYWRADSAS